MIGPLRQGTIDLIVVQFPVIDEIFNAVVPFQVFLHLDEVGAAFPFWKSSLNLIVFQISEDSRQKEGFFLRVLTGIQGE
jgi:regulatory protein YycH of two-component signal transduction system YycFG